MDDLSTSNRTLTRHCFDGVCHCDWRLAIYGCEEADAMWWIYLINIILSALVIVVGIGLLIHRVIFKGHSLWDYKRGKGCLRPKPVDCMLFLLTIFNILRLVSSTVLLKDLFPDNLIARSFLFEIPWQFGYGGFALYLVGIAQTLAESHKAISTGWLPSALFVDIIGSCFFLWPFVINNICSLIAGAFATKNLYVAEVFSRLLYGFWFLHDTALSCAVLYAGIRLVRILRGHLQKFSAAGPRYAAVKTGIFKIQLIVGTIIVCLMMFASFLLLYGILRDQIMTSTAGSIVLGVIWTYLGPFATIFVEAAIIINPKMEKNAALGANSSSADKSAGNNTTSYEMHGSTFNETITHDEHYEDITSNNFHKDNYYDLKDQQAQYQQVFQKHAMRPTLSSSIPADSLVGGGKVSPTATTRGVAGNYMNSSINSDSNGGADSPDFDDDIYKSKRRSSQDEGSSKFELMYGS